MVAYAKGSGPRNLDAACGGGKLERARTFAKTNHEECCEIGPYAKQDYSQKGGYPAKDKSCPPVKPRG